MQVAVCVQQEDNGEKGVTFFSLSDDFRDDDEWLFKVTGKAERVSDEYKKDSGSSSEKPNKLRTQWNNDFKRK